jgi:hypothetical protein
VSDFFPEEIEKIRRAWLELKRVQSDQTGSAYGEHYKLLLVLRECGVTETFEASSQIENYAEYVITYGKKPEIY